MNGIPAVVYATVATLAAIISATLAVWHGSIDGQTYTTIVTGAFALGAGAGIHAAGTQQQTANTNAAVKAAAPAALVNASTSALQAELDKRGA